MRSDLRALGTLLTMARPRWSRIASAAAAGVLTLGAAIGLAAVSAWLIARASQRPPILDLTIAVVAVRALGISRGVFRYLDRLASHDLALRGVAELREQVYSRLARGRAGAAVGLRRGDLLARFGADVDAIGDVVVRAILPAIVAVVTGAGTVVLLGAFSPAVGAVAALMLAVAGVGGPLLAAWAARRSETEAVHAQAAVAAASLSIVDGAAELRVSGRLEGMLAELAGQESRLARTLRRASWPASLAPALTTAAMGATVVAALVLGGAGVADGTIAPVELAVLVLTPLAAFEAVETLPAAAVQLLRSAAAAGRLQELFDSAGPARQVPAALENAPSTPDGPAAAEPSEPDEPDEPDEPRIVARGLAIGHPGREPIARGIDLDLGPGDALAVLGPSGAGKTTLLATLAGLLEPRAGEVLIGGVPSTRLPDGAAARIVAFTPEDAHVFDTTILENLRVARGDVTEAEATDALERAGLADFLAALPEGLDTRLGENATMMSGGERRRLLLARALLAPAPLMLLDEPGEHLDVATADALVADVLASASEPAAGAKRGVIVVSHRPESVATAHRIVRLEP